jgi:GNAT superfamily N-acetyltransferase
MVPLAAAQKRSVFESYLGGASFFPLIGAVLEGTQDGSAWADDAAQPNQVYVEHSFGFAQVFGGRVPEFEQAVGNYLLVQRSFAPAKVRLYSPQLPPFLAVPGAQAWRSERQRFCVPEGASGGRPEAQEGWTVVTADASNYEAVEAAFGVALRFWRSPQDFMRGARAAVAVVDGHPAAICYAAAVSGMRAEIDVLTAPAFRRRGIGAFAVKHFVQRCRAEGVDPWWDCFTNNTASVELCLACGFRPMAPPYPFFTLPK